MTISNENNAAVMDLPHMAEVFEALRRGKHVSLKDGDIFHALKKHEGVSDLALTWLGSPELSKCRFVHCGDYDPVGLDEFLRLKKAVGARTRLHIPENLQDLIARYGRSGLLRDSEAVLRRLRAAADPDVARVVRMLDETGCGLEQEALLLTAGSTICSAHG